MAPVSEAASLIRNFDSDVNPSRPLRQSPLAASQIPGMPLDMIERIRSFPLFQSTPDSFLAEVGLHLRPQMHSPNDYILTEGDDAKSMYWLVRGAVAVTSRDGESTYAELKPGAFFGEIGIIMDRPRTATVVARTKCLLVVLKKEDLRKILPAYPEVEQAIRDEALERLSILEKKKTKGDLGDPGAVTSPRRISKRPRDSFSGSTDISDLDEAVMNGTKKRKSPSPGPNEFTTSSALGNALVNVRALLRELPLFTSLPAELLHFLGLNALPRTFRPFTDIIKQDSMGREIFFIVKGEVEVLDEKISGRRNKKTRSTVGASQRPPLIKARLGEGQYFGEVASLSLAPRRTATVRSVTAVECLMITAEVLAAFWDRCPASVRQDVEQTARQRLSEAASPNDVVMEELDSAPAINELALDEQTLQFAASKQPSAMVPFNDAELGSPHHYIRHEEQAKAKPSDPDPFLNAGLDKVKSRSKGESLPPITSGKIDVASAGGSVAPQPLSFCPQMTPLVQTDSRLSSSSEVAIGRRRKSSTPRFTTTGAGDLIPDLVLVYIFQHLDLYHLLRLRQVSRRWSHILARSPDLVHYLDLSPHHRSLTDRILARRICPFVGDRPRVIDISGCFHVTDEGFNVLASQCGANVKVWKMRSVWDVTAPSILGMASRAKMLEEVDLSNCRKVSDTLLARIIGWVVPPRQLNGRARANSQHLPPHQNRPPPGTVFGCPFLKRLTLSYCKHVTDRTMQHIAAHASSRLESLDLTRCTTITDTGFQSWGNAPFTRLRRLCLADCTYLTDNAIIYLTNAAKGLLELDLVSTTLSAP